MKPRFNTPFFSPTLLTVSLVLSVVAAFPTVQAQTTISYANPAVYTETTVKSTAASSSITVTNGASYAVGDVIRFYGTTATTNPFGTAATNYYVSSVSGNTITVSTTPGGAAVNAVNTTTATTTYAGQNLLTGSNWTGGIAPNSSGDLANFGSTVLNAPPYVINSSTPGAGQTVYGITYNGAGSSDLTLVSGWSGTGTGLNKLTFATNDSTAPKVTATGTNRLIAFGSTGTGTNNMVLAVAGTQGLVFNGRAHSALDAGTSGTNATSVVTVKQVRLQNVDWTSFSGGITVERGELSVQTSGGLLPNQTLTVGNAQTTTNNTLASLNLGTFGSTVDGLNGTSLGRIYGHATTAHTLTVGFADGSGNYAGVIGKTTTGTTTATNLVKTGTGTQTISGVMAGTGAVTVNGGTLALNGANSYTGITTIGTNGTLKVGHLNALGTSVLGASGTFTGTLDVNGYAITNSVADKAIFGGTITNTGAAVDLSGMGTISASANRSMNVDGTGNITFGAINGNYSLTKNGTNTVTLSAANTYNGATVITQGTLALGAAGSINNTSGISLGTGGTFDVSAKSGGYTVDQLGGSGNVIGSLTVSTTLAIGNSPGTAAFSGDLTLTAGTTYLYEMVGGTSSADLGNVTGTLNLGGAILDLSQFGAGVYTPGDKFTLFSYGTGLTGTFNGLANLDQFTDAGGIWQIKYNDTAGLNGGAFSTNVTITAIPEPSAALLGGLGMLALLRRRRN